MLCAPNVFYYAHVSSKISKVFLKEICSQISTAIQEPMQMFAYAKQDSTQISNYGYSDQTSSIPLNTVMKAWDKLLFTMSFLH